MSPDDQTHVSTDEVAALTRRLRDRSRAIARDAATQGDCEVFAAAVPGHVADRFVEQLREAGVELGVDQAAAVRL